MLIAGLQGLRRAVDHPVVWREAGRHLDTVAEIAAKLAQAGDLAAQGKLQSEIARALGKHANL